MHPQHLQGAELLKAAETLQAAAAETQLCAVGARREAAARSARRQLRPLQPQLQRRERRHVRAVAGQPWNSQIHCHGVLLTICVILSPNLAPFQPQMSAQSKVKAVFGRFRELFDVNRTGNDLYNGIINLQSRPYSRGRRGRGAARCPSSNIPSILCSSPLC